MAGNVKDLIVRIMVDDSDVGKFQKAGGKAAKFGQVLDKAAIASAGALAGLAAGAVVAGKAASDLEQSAGGVDAVFGKWAGSMHTAADAAADAVGLSANEFNEFATVIGSQLKNAGVPMDQLGSKTKDLIGKAADLAATFGGTTSDAVEALSSAMKGEMDPIEKYGISLNQSMLQQQAATMGIKGSSSTWDVATKQQVILAAVTKQGGDAWGQFGKQSNTAAEQQQKAQASIKNATAQIGSILLPIMSKAAGALAGFAKWAGDNAGLVQALAIGVGILAGGVLVLSGAAKVWAGIQAIQTAAQWANNAAWLASPITWIIIAIIAAIGLLVAAGIWLYNNWDKVTKFIGEAWQNVLNWFQSIGKAISDWWNGFWNGIVGWVHDTFGPVIDWGIHTFKLLQLGLKIVGDAISKWWNGLWSGIGDFFSGIWNGLQDIVKGAWNGIVGWIEGGVNNAIGLINGIIKGINGIGGAIGIHLSLIPKVHIPRLATGGIVMGPQLAMVGDNPGGREAILPLNSPAARDMLGGNDGPVELSDSTIDKLARALAGYARVQARQGVA